MKKVLVLTICAVLVAACSRVSLYRFEGQEYAINDDGDIYRKGQDGYWTFAYDRIRDRDHRAFLDRLTKRGTLVKQISAAELYREPPPPRLPPGEGVRKPNPVTQAILPEGGGGE